MDYHGNHYFLNIKFSVFATGRLDISYVIKLKHMLYKILAVSGKVQRFSVLSKWVGYFDPSL